MEKTQNTKAVKEAVKKVAEKPKTYERDMYGNVIG